MEKITASEKNRILRVQHKHVLNKQQRFIIDQNVDNIEGSIKALSNRKAKIGPVGALEILYELGRFLNAQEEEQ
jgi:hypothetical protein